MEKLHSPPHPRDSGARADAGTVTGPPRFFYGYVIIAASMSLGICTSPGHSTGISVFIDPIMADLNTSRTAVSATWTTALLGASTLAPAAGAALDAYGPRPVALGATALMASALLLLSVATSAPMVGIALGLMRFAGPEVLIIVGSTTTNRWWVKRRGFASVLKSLQRIVVLSFPAAISETVTNVGWRVTLQGLALAVAVVGCGASGALYSDPESCGLLPDGATAQPAAGTRTPRQPTLDSEVSPPTVENHTQDTQDDIQRTAEPRPPGVSVDAAVAHPSGIAARVIDEPSWSFEDVMREPFFWLLTVAAVFFNMFWTGVSMHRIDLFAHKGVSVDDIAAMTVRAAFINSGSSFVLGLLVDKVSVSGRVNLLLVAYAAQCTLIAVLCAPASSHFGVTSAARAQLWYATYGLFVGVQSCIRSLVFADLFGRRALGSVNGVIHAMGTASAGLGPLAFGWCREATGSYRWAMTAALAMTGVSTAALSARAVPTQHRMVE
eukprot:m.80948 g.80948  ORF g.80948 m.80948 type:complete len:496 (+) comp10956_c0_seq2:167-1654(+)